MDGRLKFFLMKANGIMATGWRFSTDKTEKITLQKGLNGRWAR